MSNSNNIAENLFDAISTIAEKRIANLQYDKTIICTIVSTDNEKNNKYTVSDGNIKFEANGDGQKYKVNDSVRVLILNGDYSKEKFIQGKYSNDVNSKPITYVSAMDSILDITDNLLPQSSTIYSIAANGNEDEIQIGSEINLNQTDIQNSDIYNTIYLKGEFWSAFDQYDMRDGDYGLHLVLALDNGEDMTPRYGRLDFYFSAKDNMFGNPYVFKIFTSQEITYKLSTWPENAIAAYLYLYQDNNFKYYNEHTQATESLPCEIFNDGSVVNNIKVKNVAIGFGSEISAVEDNKLKIYTNNSLTFDHMANNDATNKKMLKLLWYNKDDNNAYVGFSDGICDPEYDEKIYLSEVSSNERLLLTKNTYGSQIPTDENCLNLQADILDINSECAKLNKLIGEELNSAIQNFDTAIAGLNFGGGERPFNQLLNASSENYLGAFALNYDTQYESAAAYFLSNFYTQILQSANKEKDVIKLYKFADSSVQLNSAQEVENECQRIHNLLGGNGENSYYYNLKTILDTALVTILNKVEEVSIYKNTYINYKNKIDKIFEKITSCCNKIYSIYSINNNANKLSSLIRFTENDILNIGETYGDKLQDESFVSRYSNHYCVYWYIKDINAETDGIMPAGWRYIDNSINKGLPTKQDANNIPYYPKRDTLAGFEYIFNQEKINETIKAVIFYNHEKIISSNELVFNNLSEVISDTLIDASGILSIEHGTKSQNAFQLYNEYGHLNNAAESQYKRTLRARFESLSGKDEQLIGGTIYWYVPDNATALNIFDLDVKDFYLVDEDQEQFKPGYKGYYKSIGGISDSDTDEKIEVNIDDTCFYYHLNNYYQSTMTNNHILCEVIKDDKIYSCIQYFVISSFGNSGTDYTLALTTNPTQTMVVDNDDNPLSININLYDYNQQLLNLNAEDIEIGFEGPSGYDIILPDPNKKYCQVIKNNDSDNYAGILKCVGNDIKIETLNNKTINLTSYFPIPYSPANTLYIEGATTIIYDSSGSEPQYYKNPYKLYNKSDFQEWHDDTEDKKVATWHIRYYYYDNNNDNWTYYTLNDDYEPYSPENVKIENIENLHLDYVPRLVNNVIIPSVLYLDLKNEQKIYPVVIATGNNNILWAQPILIMQNRYSSSLLNEWSGKLVIDDDNGTILSTMVGAGRKNNENKFEGVLMGDVLSGSGDGAAITPGIYGFNNGAQSFGFKVDGTAFLGKTGGGRIEFNGNTGVIYSNNWLQNTPADDQGQHSPFNYNPDTKKYTLKTSEEGMAIDLVNGHIDAYNFKLTSEKFELNNTPFDYTIGLGVNQIILGERATDDFDKRAGGVIFGANNNFAITENGYIYANAGKIGPITIGDIASQTKVDGDIAGINDNLNNKVNLQENGTSFSWQFLPDEGFYMYDSQSGTNVDVFKIYKNTNNNNKYEAWLSGTVIANSGQIGNWIIDENALQAGNNNNVVSLYAYAPEDIAENKIAIAAGNNNFNVRYDGRVRARTLEVGDKSWGSADNWLIGSHPQGYGDYALYFPTHQTSSYDQQTWYKTVFTSEEIQIHMGTPGDYAISDQTIYRSLTWNDLLRVVQHNEDTTIACGTVTFANPLGSTYDDYDNKGESLYFNVALENIKGVTVTPLIGSNTNKGYHAARPILIHIDNENHRVYYHFDTDGNDDGSIQYTGLSWLAYGDKLI